jgi:DNA polymerase-3 subunit alpha (Gram-positive type)
METVRKKNKFLNEEQIGKMREKGVPEWYIDSCNKIEYMFPKAHAVAYDISAIRLGWYKIYHPLAFYGAMFTVAPKGFDAEIAIKGKDYVKEQIRQITEKGNSATQKEKSLIPIWQLVVEFYARGLEFLPVDIHKSKAREFTPEDGKLRMPFGVLPNLGEKAAESIEEVMQNGGGVLSVEELRERAQISKKHIEILKRNGALEGLGETAQLSLGDFGMFGDASEPEKPAKKPTNKKTGTSSPNGGGSDQISFF